MARGKKKETLTPEERLQAALVPESEQPYKVPGNWCWTYIGCVADVVTGGTPNKKRSEYYGGIFPFFKPADLDFGRHVIQASEYLTDEGKMVSRIIPKQSTVVCCIGSIGKCGFLEVEGTTNQQINAAIPKFSPLLLYYYCNTHYFIEELWGKASATTISIVNKSKMECCTFPLPPLTEQQRIVDRIESLFAKLDEAKQKAQDALDSFESRKAATLHKAFTGELTAQWRKEHGVGMESWVWKSLKTCGSWYGGGTPSMAHPEYWENGTLLWVTSKDMKSDLIEDTLMHTNMLGVENSATNYIEKPAVLFVMRSGILRRTFPVCMVKKPFTVNQDLKALIPTTNINLEYLFWVCKAHEKQILEKCMKSGTTVESINATALHNFTIPIAGDKEQAEIVRTLDNLLAKEQQAKEAAEGVLGQIDLIKKAILARAFRGELGTNAPGEESAVELMRQLVNDELG